ncbi:unnamed protein product [Schistosoma mattheei]|uniref:Uncharacterized protein n=1 Tax=Schistosoma mattheei TaxID=31246 RepID=A0A183PPC9_9TREM|nr:unnamed protein product [Schistosoma mattheei]
MEPDEIIARVKSKGIHELIGNEFITTSNIMNRSQSIQQRSSLMGFSKTTLNSVTDSVFNSKPSLTSLRLLQSDSLNVQFALNVYVKAYPGPVLSIWIYMAALWRRTITELSYDDALRDDDDDDDDDDDAVHDDDDRVNHDDDDALDDDDAVHDDDDGLDHDDDDALDGDDDDDVINLPI